MSLAHLLPSETPHWCLISEVPMFFGLHDIAHFLVEDAETACRRGESAAEIRILLEQRVGHFCFCLNDDDANDFRRLLAAELDLRSR